MKYKWLILFLFLGACRPTPIIDAPTIVQVEDVDPQLNEENSYVPSVQWKIKENTLENNFEEASRSPTGAVYKLGGITAVAAVDGNKLRLDCSTGGSVIALCLADGGNIVVHCEMMVFKLECSLK